MDIGDDEVLIQKTRRSLAIIRLKRKSTSNNLLKRNTQTCITLIKWIFDIGEKNEAASLNNEFLDHPSKSGIKK